MPTQPSAPVPFGQGLGTGAERAAAKAPQTPGKRDERAWVRRAQAGSASDFEALFRAHWAPAYRAAYLVVRDAAAAEDIAQEAFLAAVRALDRFDRHRPFGPWLHRIVVNRAIDWARHVRCAPRSSCPSRRPPAPRRPPSCR